MNTKLNCVHCNTPAVVPVYLDDNEEDNAKVFCCYGCRSVYLILHGQGLDHYYHLKKDASSLRAGSPASIKIEKYEYLDDPQFAKDFVKSDSENNKYMEFYLEGVHCVACLWLMEKLPTLIDDVLYSSLNLSKSILKITINEEGQFSTIAKKIAEFGYTPHPIQKEDDASKLKQMEERFMLMKIGIAGGISGNIMILAVSLYAGATGELGKQFEWLSFILSIPVLTYCALPFYKNFINFFHTKQFSVDVPVTIALITGFFSGLYNLIKGSGEIYFDSLCILIFLLLGSRYILQKAQNIGLGGNDLRHFFSLGKTHLLNPQTSQYEDILARYLKTGDRIKVLCGETIPVDAIVTAGISSLNTSMLTGESLPTKVSKGDLVYSGTINISEDLYLEVLNVEDETRLGKILNQIIQLRGDRSSIVGLADIISKYFVFTVIFISILIICFFTYYNQFEVGLERALTLIIITCPCALGLATPLALTRALSYFSSLGILVRGEDVVERLGSIEKIFFDKTGTLTYGNFKVVDSINHRNDLDKEKLLNITMALEKKSGHPLAISLCQYIIATTPVKNMEVEDYWEEFGTGVSGIVDTQKYFVKSSSKDNFTIGLFLEEEEVYSFLLEDEVRIDSYTSLKKLRNLGLDTYLLSGDKNGIVEKVAKTLQFNKDQIFSGKSPEEKCETIQSFSNTMMVGDGANDALAFNASVVGVAVHGSVEVSLQAADVYCSISGVNPLYQLIIVSKETMKLIYRNLGLSLVYNIIGATLAILGLVTPLMAAVLMPLSSVTVLLSTILANKKLGKH